MIKKLFIISSILFVIACLAPFKSGYSVNLNPEINNKLNSEKEADFYSSAKRSEYTEKNTVAFSYSKDLNIDAPSVIAESAIAIDLDNYEIIFSKNESQTRPVASLVKVMTAIIAVEHLDINSKTTISKNAAKTGENTMGLVEGEIFSIKELLMGLILNSANDAAVAIAEKTAKSEDQFVNYMNIKANLLGADNTLFADASGLNLSKADYYSTAVDMAKISAYSLENHPILREIYQTTYFEIPNNEEHGFKILENQTNLLTTYPGVKGIKTGYTEEAGLCLISYAENGGKKVLVVVLNSTDRKGDAILLLDYGFERLGVEVDHNLL